MNAVLLLSGAAAAAAFLFSKKAQALGVGTTVTNPASAPEADRGIYIAGQPVGTNYSPNNIGQQLVRTGTSAGLQGGAALATATASKALTIAVPVVGAIAAVGLGIWSAISQHHQQAVAAEAAGLNAAVPHFRNGLIIVVRGLLSRELTAQQAVQIIDQMKEDYYVQVKAIIKGRWPHRGPADFANPSAGKPDPCNGACVVGHYWIEGDGEVVKAYAPAILQGQHGNFQLDAVPAHAGYNGSPAITIRY